jgi:hypothetical protein
MQQSHAQEEMQYADGHGEYTSFHGGPSYNYLAPAKMATETIQQLSASLLTDMDLGRQPRSSSLQHAISYNLAANHPTYRTEAEGLQIAYQQSNHTPPVTHRAMRQGYSTKEAESSELSHTPPFAGHRILHSAENIMHSRYRHANVGYETPSAVPAPLNFRQRKHAADRYVLEFPQPPTSPTSPTSQHHLHPAFRTSGSQHVSSSPQPLRFQRSNTMPPSPPQSMGARTDEDALRDQMQYLNMGNPPQVLGRTISSTSRHPPTTLGRMNTMSSMNSARSSSTPGSPFEQRRRISVAYPDSSISGVLEQNHVEMSPAEAHAEVLRRLERAEETSSRTSGGPVKKGFSLRRSNTTKPTSNLSHSQEALTTVLEDAAEEGNLDMVEAVIDLGADPIYRSTGKMKKVKHEALAKATAGGHAWVVDYLLSKGATYGEAQKKSAFTPMDRVLLGAAYKGHAELVSVLIVVYGANPMIEQWPREMDDAQQYWNEKHLRLAKTSVMDGISHWKNEDQGLSVLRVIMQSSKFDPTMSVSGVFDNRSELQSAEFAHRPWQTTYEYSAMACFVRAGWADAVEALLSINSSPQDYEKEDEVLQYQDRMTRYISPVNALTKDTWEQRPEDALRILRLLIDKGFNVSLAQHTANDIGKRTPLARALVANASQAVELIAQSRPELVKEVISFRRNKKETKAQPLATAIALEKLETARVLLRAGAHPRDPAFDMNVLQFAAHQGGETGTAMLAEILPLAPELTYAALDTAISRINKDCVRVLLDYISAAASRNEVAALPAIWDMLLPLPEDAETQTNYLDIIDMVYAWDAGFALPRPQLPAILAGIRRDNYIGMERLLQLGVVDGKSLVLNCKAQPAGEQGMWTVLECAEATRRSADWLGLLRGWGAPLYT